MAGEAQEAGPTKGGSIEQARTSVALMIAHYTMRRGESRTGPKSVAQTQKRRAGNIGLARTGVALIAHYAMRREESGRPKTRLVLVFVHRAFLILLLVDDVLTCQWQLQKP